MDAQAKQQIVERVKGATNILVTVSSNPSVDQLAACIGLTLLLNKMDKHATAVFSGKVPSTLEFLQPEKTIETNTNSLQDFIISLDKNKADKLRYKVEDQVVRIFITPYRTSIGQQDLVFSQGDFNVDVVLALGIKDQAHVDQAIASHGRILHDATVISINAGAGQAPQLGQINWQEPTASSLCEMLVSISEAFGAGLIDNQMATAFLTGIVAETNRFSNNRTSPKVMTMAAQLMAAGANQQLIVSKLEPPAPPPPPPAPAKPPIALAKPAPAQAVPAAPATTPKITDTLKISHQKAKDEAAAPVNSNPEEIHIDKQGNLVNAEGKSLSEDTPPAEVPEAPAAEPEPAQPAIQPKPPMMNEPKPLSPPTENPHPHALLGSSSGSPFSADTQQNGEWVDPYSTTPMDVLGNDSSHDKELFQHTKALTDDKNSAEPTEVDHARSAVENALSAAPFDPSFSPPVDSLNAQPVGPELHATDGETPSLSLPEGSNGDVSTTTPPPTEDGVEPPAPPPVPPPLPLNSNPGAMLPNNSSPNQSSSNNS